MKFSDDDSALLLAIQMLPNQTIQQYSTSLSVPFIKALHSLNMLKQHEVVLEKNGALAVDLEKLSALVDPESTEENNAEEVAKEDTMAKVYRTLTRDELFKDVCAAHPNGKTAGEYAKEFGCKGTSLNWHFRTLIHEGKVEKRLDKYYKAGPESQCVSIPVPVVEPVPEKTVQERIAEPVPKYEGPRSSHVMAVETQILSARGEWTWEEISQQIKHLDYDPGAFETAFKNLITQKKLNARELTDSDYRYVQYGDKPDKELAYSAVNVVSDFEVTRLVNDYIRQMRKQSYTLHEFVEKLKLRHDLILRVFQSSVRYMYDDDEQVVRVRGYNLINELNAEEIREFIEDGVSLKVFIKRFGLDPAEKDKLVNVMRTLKIASYDDASEWLFPLKEKSEIKPFVAEHVKIEVVIDPTTPVEPEEKKLEHIACVVTPGSPIPEEKLGTLTTIEPELQTLIEAGNKAAAEIDSNRKLAGMPPAEKPEIVYDEQNNSIGVRGTVGPDDSGTGRVTLKDLGDHAREVAKRFPVLTQDEILSIGNHDAEPIFVEPEIIKPLPQKTARQRFPESAIGADEAIDEYVENLDKIMPRKREETVKVPKEGDRVEFDTKPPVKPEWSVVLELLAERHKKCPTTKRVLHEIKEHLEQ